MSAGALRRGRHQTPGDGRWQPQHDEQVRRVEIILAGFVDDAKVALSRRFTIRKNLIDLSLLQILRTVVTDAESERRCRLVSSHRFHSKKRLIFSPFRPTPCASCQEGSTLS